MAKSRAPRRPLWLITNRDEGRMGVFTLGSGGEAETLPVFSFEEEAKAFLLLGDTETGWQTRETTAGELISLLYGPCSGVKKVALDPLPVADGEVVFGVARWGRRDFLRDFVGATPATDHKRRTAVIASPEGESPDGEGTPSRETGTEPPGARS